MSRLRPGEGVLQAPAATDPTYDPMSSELPRRDPGAPGGAVSVRLPAVDERRAVPEAGEEYIDGRRVEVQPAEAPHADRQCQLAFVVRACVGKGFVASTELLTRTDVGNDFATDVCIRKAGKDPTTGRRYLEEVSFEVAHTQRRRDLDDRARKLVARGVRRVFALVLAAEEVQEWSQADDAWTSLERDAEIRDRTLKKPLRVRALVDAGAADRLVSQALWAKREPYLVEVTEEIRAQAEAKGEARGRAEGEARGRAEGEARARAEAILQVLAARGLEPDGESRRRILECRDSQRLRRWLERAVVAESVSDLFV